MSTGQVKWFNNTKGYGFIMPDGEDNDLFAHYSEITMEGYKTLKAGQRVSYESADGPKGRHATKIQPLDTPPAEPAAKSKATSADSPEPEADSPEPEADSPEPETKDTADSLGPDSTTDSEDDSAKDGDNASS